MEQNKTKIEIITTYVWPTLHLSLSDRLPLILFPIMSRRHIWNGCNLPKGEKTQQSRKWNEKYNEHANKTAPYNNNSNSSIHKRTHITRCWKLTHTVQLVVCVYFCWLHQIDQMWSQNSEFQFDDFIKMKRTKSKVYILWALNE